MPKFRKKPVVIEAWRWDETQTMKQMLESIGMRVVAHRGHRNRPDECLDLRIATLEGSHIVSPGDFIIKGVNSEFYPCKPEIFVETYETASDDVAPVVCSADERSFGDIIERIIDKFRENKILVDTIRCRCWTNKYGVLEFDVKLSKQYCV